MNRCACLLGAAVLVVALAPGCRREIMRLEHVPLWFHGMAFLGHAPATLPDDAVDDGDATSETDDLTDAPQLVAGDDEPSDDSLGAAELEEIVGARVTRIIEPADTAQDEEAATDQAAEEYPAEEAVADQPPPVDASQVALIAQVTELENQIAALGDQLAELRRETELTAALTKESAWITLLSQQHQLAEVVVSLEIELAGLRGVTPVLPQTVGPVTVPQSQSLSPQTRP
jgi:cytoskeletal protein RodZ